MSLDVGANVPRRGNAFSRWLGRTILTALGWRLAGAVPNLPKMVLIGAPHTSNMDGVIALATLSALGLQASTMIKDTAFKGALGILLRWLGAFPVNRRSPKGVIDQTIDLFNSRQAFLMLMAPEGTRGAPETWKRGYWLVSAGAKAPILPAACNYLTMTITFGPALMPTGNYEADERVLLEFYRDFSAPRHPQGMSKPLCDIMGRTWQPRRDTDGHKRGA